MCNCKTKEGKEILPIFRYRVKNGQEIELLVCPNCHEILDYTPQYNRGGA